MDRRNFLAAAAVASVSPLSRLEALGQPAPRQFFELRRYHLLPGAKQRAFTAFVGSAAIPAMNRAGVGQVLRLGFQRRRSSWHALASPEGSPTRASGCSSRRWWDHFHWRRARQWHGTACA